MFDPLTYIVSGVCIRFLGLPGTLLMLAGLTAITAGLMGWQRSKRNVAAVEVAA